MKLYYFEVLNPRKACAMARHLQSPVDFVLMNVEAGEHKTPQFLALNPNGKLPVLVDGETTLWESNAIMCHLAHKANSDLWPSDSATQIEVLRWLSWNAEHFTNYAGALYFEYYIKTRFDIGKPDQAVVDEARDYVRKYGEVLDNHLAGRNYLLGDRLTVADFATAITLPYAAIIHLPLEGFRNIERWHDRMNEMPAWREPFPALKAAA